MNYWIICLNSTTLNYKATSNVNRINLIYHQPCVVELLDFVAFNLMNPILCDLFAKRFVILFSNETFFVAQKIPETNLKYFLDKATTDCTEIKMPNSIPYRHEEKIIFRRISGWKKNLTKNLVSNYFVCKKFGRGGHSILSSIK